MTSLRTSPVIGVPFYFRDVGETERQALNEWMRTASTYDAVIGFDAAVRDPTPPSKFQEACHSGTGCTRATRGIV